jgi:hypothetical protein
MSGSLLSRLRASIQRQTAQAEQLQRSAERADRHRFDGLPPTGFGALLPGPTREQIDSMDDMSDWHCRSGWFQICSTDEKLRAMEAQLF